MSWRRRKERKAIHIHTRTPMQSLLQQTPLFGAHPDSAAQEEGAAAAAAAAAAASAAGLANT